MSLEVGLIITRTYPGDIDSHGSPFSFLGSLTCTVTEKTLMCFQRLLCMRMRAFVELEWNNESLPNYSHIHQFCVPRSKVLQVATSRIIDGIGAR